MCHATELSKLIKSNFSSQASRMVLLISDGGPYHRLTCLSVKVALIALFLNLNVDMLIAIRTHPHQSWSNMAGRVMSTLNLALQNVSLARVEMDPELEAKIPYKTTLTQLREAIEKSPLLPVAFCDSMSPVIAHLAVRFNQMKLKEDPISYVAACDKKLVSYLNCFRFILLETCQLKLTQALKCSLMFTAASFYQDANES